MNERDPNTFPDSRRRPIRPEDSARLARTILHCASRASSRTDFLHEVSNTLMDFSGCDAVEVRLNHGDLHYRWEAARRPDIAARLEVVRWTHAADGKVIPALAEDSDLERLCREVACRQFDSSRPFFTNNGSFWTGNAWERVPLGPGTGQAAEAKSLCVGGHYRSLAIIRFFVDEATIGLLHLKSEGPDYLAKEDIEFYEGAAQALGLAVAGRRAERALRERVKELTCLYGIAQVAEQPDVPLEEMLQRIVKLLPPAWQYPEVAAARIALDDHAYASPGFRQSRYEQSADIVVAGRRRGVLQVVYLEERPEFAAGPFLKEEEKLISAVAREVALVVERKEAEKEKAALQQQLMHADRLATIGKLAAGVAHELNEPLGSILGFAQLAKKCPGLPQPAGRDIEKIVTASLYAREVIKKLMVFARQVPARKAQLNLNQVVEEALYFLEARCAKGGIQVVRVFSPDMPDLHADPAQLKQVLVNLVVNAVQAMPDGGTLTVGTQVTGSTVSVVVQDTGIGMSEDVLPKIFLPFFTTKDVSEGTGLGLAVVHGIVVSHGGSIDVQSHPGQGTRFEVRLPAVARPEAQETGQDDTRN